MGYLESFNCMHTNIERAAALSNCVDRQSKLSHGCLQNWCSNILLQLLILHLFFQQPGCHITLKFMSCSPTFGPSCLTTTHAGGPHDNGCIVLLCKQVALDHSSAASTHKLTMTNWIIENLVFPGLRIDMGPTMHHNLAWFSKDLPHWHMYTYLILVLILIPLFFWYEHAGYYSSWIRIIAASSCPSAYYSYWSACNYFQVRIASIIVNFISEAVLIWPWNGTFWHFIPEKMWWKNVFFIYLFLLDDVFYLKKRGKIYIVYKYYLI